MREGTSPAKEQMKGQLGERCTLGRSYIVAFCYPFTLVSVCIIVTTHERKPTHSMHTEASSTSSLPFSGAVQS